MTDESIDPRFERDLRLLLADLAPSDAPASLRASVAAVPRVAARRRRWHAPRPAVRALVAAAAVVVVALAALASGILRPPNLPSIGTPATPATTADPRVSIGYEAVVPATAAELQAVADILEARLVAAGIDGDVTLDGSTVRATVADPARAQEARELLGTPGRLDFVPLGTTPATPGEVVDLTAFPPLFSGDEVADARIGVDQNGLRTVDFTLGPEGRRLFAEYTQASIGHYVAITLDGTVISAPVIQSSIPNGEVQISQGGVGGYPEEEARRLVAILRGGALPVPIREVAVTASTPPTAFAAALHVENRGGPALAIRIAGMDVLTVPCGDTPALAPGEAGVPPLPWDLEVRRAADGASLLSQRVTELPRWLVQVGDAFVGGLQPGPVEGPPGPSCAPAP